MPLPWGADQGSAEDMMRLLRIQSPLMAVAACGLPGLQVPIGVVEGLPVGVQLVAASFREMRLLNAGAVIEADHGDLNAMRWARRGPDRTV
jgi:amidase